jgi:hypothetical protein
MGYFRVNRWESVSGTVRRIRRRRARALGRDMIPLCEVNFAYFILKYNHL